MDTMPPSDEIGTLPFFRGLDLSEIEQIRTQLSMITCTNRHEIIDKTRKKKDKSIYIINQGAAKVQIQDLDDPEERSVILAILGPGQIIGEMSFADGRDYSASIVALTHTVLLSMSHASLEKFLLKMPILMRNLAWILADRLRLSNRHIQSLATLKVRTRVARQIKFLAETYGQQTTNDHIPIPFGLTQVDLASLVGATRMSILRAIGELEKHKVIAVESRRHMITILDQSALEARCRSDWHEGDV